MGKVKAAIGGCTAYEIGKKTHEHHEKKHHDDHHDKKKHRGD